MTELQKTLIIVTGRDKTAVMIAAEGAENKHARQYANFLISQMAHCIKNVSVEEFLNSADEKYDNDPKMVPARYLFGSLLLLAGYRNKFEDLEEYMENFKLPE